MTLRRKLKEHRENLKAKENVVHLRQALERIHELNAHIEAIKRLAKVRPQSPIKARHGIRKSEATAIAVMSDVHYGEQFTKEQTNGVSEYNTTICRIRCAKFFERIVRLTNKERQDIPVDELVLFLGGDLIDGALHLDTIMANEISEPIKQAAAMQSIIEAGILLIIKEGNFKKITVVCCDGNHGRITTKQHHHSRAGNALEHYMYYNLAMRFEEISWYVGDSMLKYVPIYDSVIRFMHGDRISFGGVNGFYTYLHRKLYEWDTAVRADFTVLGHLHQYTPTRRYLVNGSVPGYNPFSIAIGAKKEPPIQAFMLWDKLRGPTVHIPILVDL
jgi:hypothetical protein